MRYSTTLTLAAVLPLCLACSTDEKAISAVEIVSFVVEIDQHDCTRMKEDLAALLLKSDEYGLHDVPGSEAEDKVTAFRDRHGARLHAAKRRMESGVQRCRIDTAGDVAFVIQNSIYVTLGGDRFRYDEPE